VGIPVVTLRPGREKTARQRHPWIFSGAVQHVDGNPADGETVVVQDHHGEFLLSGAYSSRSQICVRAWSWRPEEAIDREFFRRRLAAALQARQALLRPEVTDAARLVYAESDGLPGLIVDRYAGILAVQFLSCGTEAWRETLVELLVELTGAASVYERSDAEVRKLEGLEARRGWLLGAAPNSQVIIEEHGLHYLVDVAGGHKTGFYLDQRQNRRIVGQMSAGRQVLDCFCYTGGFTVSALAGGAAGVLAVDESGAALALAAQNCQLNQLPVERAQWLQGDVFQVLRKLRDQGQSFDLIILDPPKFAPTAASVEKAARGYKDINLLAFKLLNPGGLLFTFSCSGGVSAELFQMIVAGAALDAGVEAQIILRLSQDRDHPTGIFYPDGAYLKGLCLNVARAV
jgi:23S rRNA (cytosine1962-C5)-methyltransferase